MSTTTTEVVVVIGAGSIGQAIGRRTGAGKHLLLADSNETNLKNAKAALEDAGHTVSTQRVDVSDAVSVRALARAAAGLGDVVQVISTAGVSPVQAQAQAVLAVDLYGTAVVLEEFGKVIAPGGAGVHISSMAGHMAPPLDPETGHALAFTPVEELLALRVLAPDAVPNSGAAYAVSKQANRLRVQAAAVTWGDRGARVNCISPASSSPRWRATRCPARVPRATRSWSRSPPPAGSAPPTRSPPPLRSSSARTPASSPAPTSCATAASSPPCAPADGSCPREPRGRGRTSTAGVIALRWTWGTISVCRP